MTAEDYKAMLFHVPYTRMGAKAMKVLEGKISDEKYSDLQSEYQASIEYGKIVGNLYTGSLYLGLISYLINSKVQANEKLLLFSYGSGAMGELFSVQVTDGFKENLPVDAMQKLLADRQKISIPEYEKIFGQTIENGQSIDPTTVTGKFYLSEIKENERLYQKK